MGVEAARRAVRLAPRNGRAQLALAQALARTGDARGAFGAATLATELLPGDPAAREALADAHWLAGDDAAAFAEFRALAAELGDAGRRRVMRKARTLYRQHAGVAGRLLAALPPVFDLALRRGWVRIGA
jgi:Flp pilus assembly protein TadD